MKQPRRPATESAAAKLERLKAQVKAAKEWQAEALDNRAVIVGDAVILEMHHDPAFALAVSEILRRRVVKPRQRAEIAVFLIETKPKAVPKPPPAPDVKP